MIKLIKIIYFIFISFHFLFFSTVNAQEKIKIGLLVPMTGENKEIGESIIKAVGLAVKDIDNNSIGIILCKESKNKELQETVNYITKPMGVAGYQLAENKKEFCGT